MSFDLTLLDLDQVPDVEDLIDAMEDDSAWGQAYTPKLAALVAELEQRFPGDAPDSPWASWPLSDSILDGRGCALNIQFAYAEKMLEAIVVASRSHGVILYDHQEDEFHRPA